MGSDLSRTCLNDEQPGAPPPPTRKQRNAAAAAAKQKSTTAPTTSTVDVNATLALPSQQPSRPGTLNSPPSRKSTLTSSQSPSQPATTGSKPTSPTQTLRSPPKSPFGTLSPQSSTSSLNKSTDFHDTSLTPKSPNSSRRRARARTTTVGHINTTQIREEMSDEEGGDGGSGGSEHGDDDDNNSSQGGGLQLPTSEMTHEERQALEEKEQSDRAQAAAEQAKLEAEEHERATAYELSELSYRLGPSLKLVAAGYDEATVDIPRYRPLPVTTYTPYTLTSVYTNNNYEAQQQLQEYQQWFYADRNKEYWHETQSYKQKKPITEVLPETIQQMTQLSYEELHNFGFEYLPAPLPLIPFDQSRQEISQKLRMEQLQEKEKEEELRKKEEWEMRGKLAKFHQIQAEKDKKNPKKKKGVNPNIASLSRQGSMRGSRKNLNLNRAGSLNAGATAGMQNLKRQQTGLGVK